MLIKKIAFTGWVLTSSVTAAEIDGRLEEIRFQKTSLKTMIYGEINDPDRIYKAILNSHKADKTAFILDVDGTLSNEDNPENLGENQIVTERGRAVENLRRLMEQGALIVFCSAWHKLDETIKRLRQIGFTDEDLSISEEEQEQTQAVSLTHNKTMYIINFKKLGNVISVKHEKPWEKKTYFRNKAFSLMFLQEGGLPEQIETIYFLDDSAQNHEVFINDILTFDLYPNIQIYNYLLTEPIPIK
ncbi:hypothetical protein [Candidatus Paracaedibacter symbiosus]|uniref:hypothetical protein n=1 Tax=Candidatus Paracaedibacter symbiosus TaxID=244582 RepID=UPI00050941CA|nr:hypothetical protein [Candidatus Paracaedibacter symbiosus]